MCQACSVPFTSIDSFCPHSTMKQAFFISPFHRLERRGAEQSGDHSKDPAELGFGLEETWPSSLKPGPLDWLGAARIEDRELGPSGDSRAELAADPEMQGWVAPNISCLPLSTSQGGGVTDSSKAEPQPWDPVCLTPSLLLPEERVRTGDRLLFSLK